VRNSIHPLLAPTGAYTRGQSVFMIGLESYCVNGEVIQAMVHLTSTSYRCYVGHINKLGHWEPDLRLNASLCLLNYVAWILQIKK